VDENVSEERAVFIFMVDYGASWNNGSVLIRVRGDRAVSQGLGQSLEAVAFIVFVKAG
jgi:hypothetical protein